MRKGASLVVTAVVVLAVMYVAGNRSASVQGQGQVQSVAAVPGEKGGQDIFGGYDVADWPKPLTDLPGHGDWTWGAGQSVFAESPDRVFVLQRGELPTIHERPARVDVAPSISFPIGRLPIRDATSASPPGRLFMADGTTPGDDLDKGTPGVEYRWEHIVTVFNAQGDMIEDWTQWDEMFRRPHAVYISPYDPEKNIWIVDDYRHSVFKFSNDGQRLLQTLGEPNVPGTDDSHFYRPTFMAWLPDGTFYVADGYTNTRIMKFDKDGNFLMTWGERGTATGRGGTRETRPGYFNNVHGVAVDPETRRVFVNDRSNGRVQVFDENGVFLDDWSFGPRPPMNIHDIYMGDDGILWAADQGGSKLLGYDADGNFIYSWGTFGTCQGCMWGVHGFHTDMEGNLYTSEVRTGRVQKFTPREGANPAFLVGKPWPRVW